MSTITVLNNLDSGNTFRTNLNTNLSNLNTDKLEASDIAGKQDILLEGAFVNGDKTKLDGIEEGAEANTVDSVNSKNGVVVLDADDIDDTTTTNKFVTAGDLTNLGNLSGTNSGDVRVTDSSNIDLTLTGQDLTADLTNTTVTPGSYILSSVTVDSKGRITSISNGSLGGTPLTTKGDLLTYDTGDARLPVGTNGQVLTADSTQATGIKWDTPAGGGDMLASTYDPTSVSGDAFDMDNMVEGTTNLILSPVERNYLKNIQSTSSITTPTVSINTDTTKFDIGAFVGVFIDNYTDSNNPTRIILNYAGTTANVVTNLATADATILTINSSGTIIQRTRQPTIEELRDEILIGSLTHTNRTNISTAVSVGGVPSYDIANSLFAGSVALGPVNLAGGNIYTGNSTSGLKLDKTAGNTYQIGINRYNNPKNPDITTDTAGTAITFLYSWRDGSGGFNSLLTDTLLPGRYDNGTGGTGQPNGLASNNKWYLCKIYRTVVSNLTIIEFGQVEYASLSEAIANKGDTTVVNPILGTTQFRGWLALRGGATDIYTNGEVDGVFIDAGIFSTTTGGSSLGTATTTLNGAYLNSTQPQIEVDDTRGSLQAKNNRALDTSAVFEVLNKAGTPTVSVTGEGKINGNTISSGTTSGNNTGDETTATIGTLINSATEKTTPVDTDMVGLMDSGASNILKKLSWLNIKATAKTYFDTVYDALGAASTAETNAKSYADGLVVGLWDDRGTFDASVNAYPSTGGSGTAGAILKGDTWTVSVAGTLPTAQVVEIGDIVRALTDTPGNTQANWAIQQNNIGYTAENSANKSTTLDADKTSDTKYPSVKSVYDWAVGLFASKGANSDITSLSGLTTPLSIAQGGIGSTTLAGASIATYAGTETLTNKRITTRVNTITSSATPTPAGDTTDEFTVTALAADATFAAPTGTPTEGQVLLIRIKDDGTARTLAWNAIYRASSDLALPTTTVISKTLYLQFVYNDTDSKWDLLGLLNNF